MSAMGPDTGNAARNDRITAVVLFALGLAMLAGGVFMDRLEVRRIHPASIPGLVPMLLGVTLALCAVILYRGAGAVAPRDGPSDDASLSADAPSGSVPPANPASGAPPVHAGREADSWGRLIGAGLWSVVYALLLVGTFPFAVATAIYLFGFVAGFGWRAAGEGGSRAALLVKAGVLAIVASAAIATLFSEGFLVRLP